MRNSRTRAMTWTLVALGVGMVALGGVLAATFPWQQAPWGPMGSPQAAPQASGQQPEGSPQGTQPGGPQAQVPPGGPQAQVPPGSFGPWYAWHGWHRPGYGYGWGRGYGPWGYWRPHFFGGGLLFIALIILVISFFVRRRRYGYYRRWGDARDAEEILRRSFAEGRITEEEYKSRLAALRK